MLWPCHVDLYTNISHLIISAILKQVIEKCVDGANILEVCEFGDKLMSEETAKVYKKEKEMKKGRTLE